MSFHFGFTDELVKLAEHPEDKAKKNLMRGAGHGAVAGGAAGGITGVALKKLLKSKVGGSKGAILGALLGGGRAVFNRLAKGTSVDPAF